MVFLQGCAAAAGVGDDGVEICLQESVDVVACQRACFFATPCVGVEGAAAALGGWDYNFTAVLLEDADGGLVEAGEEDVGDAAAQHCDAILARAFGEEDLAVLLVEAGELSLGGKVIDLAERAHQFEEAAGVDQTFKTGLLVEPHETTDQAEHPGSLKQRAVGEVFDLLPREGPLDFRLDFGAGGFDQLAVFDTGWAGSFASAAAEAEGHMFEVAFVHGCGTAGDLDHLVDAAAGGIHFNAELTVGGAGVEAEATVDTLVEVFLLGGVGMTAFEDS